MPAEGTHGRFGRDAARFDWPQAAERILPRQRDDALRFIGTFLLPVVLSMACNLRP